MKKIGVGGAHVTIGDLERIKDEFEQINRSYRESFTVQARLEMIERVKNLIWHIENIKRVQVTKTQGWRLKRNISIGSSIGEARKLLTRELPGFLLLLNKLLL